MARGPFLIAALLLGAAGVMGLWIARGGSGPQADPDEAAAPDARGTEDTPGLTVRVPTRATQAEPTAEETTEDLLRLEIEYAQARPKDGGIGLVRRWAAVGPRAVPALLLWSTRAGRRWSGFTRGSLSGEAIYLIGEPALAPLRQALADEREGVRAASARLLWELTRDVQSTLPHLVAYLGGERIWRTDFVAGNALRSLWQMGEQAAPARGLMNSLVDVDQTVGASDYLVSRGGLPVPTALPVRRARRTVAAWALAVIGRIGEDSSAALTDLERAARSAKDSRKQQAALRALLDLGDRGLVILDRMLRGADPLLSGAAADVLLHQKPEAVILAAAMQRESVELRCRCMWAVGNAAARSGLAAGTRVAWLPRLQVALEGAEPTVSRSAARAVTSLVLARGAGYEVNARGKQLLLQALQHAEFKTRSEAAIGLSKGWWSSAEARRALMGHYGTLDRRARAAVLGALGTDDEPDARRDELLLGALEDVDEFVQVAALKALGRVMQDKLRLTAILESAGRSPSEHVRSAAARLAEDLAGVDEED